MRKRGYQGSAECVLRKRPLRVLAVLCCYWLSLSKDLDAVWVCGSGLSSTTRKGVGLEKVSTNSRSSSGVLREAAAHVLIGGRVLQDVVRRLAEHGGSRPRPVARDQDGVHLLLQIRAAVLPLGVVPRVAVREAKTPPFLGKVPNPT